MSGHGEKMTRKRELAIIALLREPTLAAAARSTGVSATTLKRWLQDPDFLNEYRGVSRRLLEGSLARLQAVTDEAIDALRRNLTCGRPSTEVAAAKAIVQQATKAAELWDLTSRVEDLEALVTPTPYHERKGMM